MPTSSKLVAVVALLVGLLAGLALGPASAPPLPESKQDLVPSVQPDRAREQALRQELGLLREQLAARGRLLKSVTKQHIRRAAGPLTDSRKDESTGPEPASVRELVAAMDGMLADGSLFRSEVMAFVQGQLLEEMRGDQQALRWVVGRFRAAPGSPLGGQLAAVLGMIKDPEVERVGIELIRAGGSQASVEAGLELLGRLDIASPRTRRAMLALLSTDRRTAVVGAALDALKPAVTDPQEAREVILSITPLTAHRSAEVRRRAVIALAGWSRDAAGLAPVLRALRDQSATVRAGAAFALSRTRQPGQRGRLACTSIRPEAPGPGIAPSSSSKSVPSQVDKARGVRDRCPFGCERDLSPLRVWLRPQAALYY